MEQFIQNQTVSLMNGNSKYYADSQSFKNAAEYYLA